MLRPCRQRTNFRSIRGRVETHITVRKAKHLFRIIRVAAGFHLPSIGQEIIHGRQSAAPRVADPFDLNRCRLTREDQEPIAVQVSAEVEENVDPVVADLLGKLLVRVVLPFRPSGPRPR